MSQTILKKMQCPRCFQNGGDKSKDNLVVYLNEDKSESAHCFVCLYTIPSLDYKKKYGTHIPKEIIFPVNKYTQDDWLKDLPNYNTNPKNFRGLKKSTCAKYRVRHEYDEETGEVAVQFYPVTKDYEFSGIKKRIALPEKDFRALGTVSKHCDLFGENIFKDAHLSQGKVKTVVLTSGELDALTVYQMLDDNRQELNARNNTDYATVPVLSGVVGEAGNINQYRLKYDFLNRYDRIVYIPDQDEAGEDALHRLASALPRDKLFVVHLPSGCKDPTYMLEQGKEKDFIKAYWNPSAYNPAGVVGSSSLLDRMQEDLMTEKVPLPPFMYEFQNMLAGGFKVESIINIGAASGAGKCLAPGTLVRMADYTLRKVEDIKIGDRVLNPEGSFNTVTALSSGVSDMYTVKQAKGINYTVNENHILSLFNLKTREVENLKIKDYLACGHKDRLRGYKATLEKSPELNPLNVSEELAWLIGLWLGDGASGSARITVHSSETEIISRIEKYSEKLGYAVVKKDYNDTGTYLISIHGLIHELHRFNLQENKHVPSYFFTCPRSIKKALLAGLIDSDGHFSANAYDFIFKSVFLAESIKTLIHSLGFYVSVKPCYKSAHKNHRDIYQRFYVSGINEDIPVAAPRKQFIKPQNYTNKLLSKIEVEKTEEGQYFGFSIDGNHLFCLEDFTVTHNSTLVNEMIYHWIYHSPYKIGIISLELSAPQYGVALGSRHLGRKLSLFEKGEEAVAFINLPENREKLIDLYQTETGLDRFHLVDERDGGLDAIKKLVEKLIISCDCRVIILDPLQDVMAGLGNPEQEEFLAWMKSMIKRYSIIFININHVRKSGNGSEANSAGAMITEEDFAGSSTIFKSASVNLLFTRNKYLANDNPYRNIIHSYCSKNRNTGLGGDCGDYYYDNNTHTLHALDVYRAQHPEAFDAWDAKEALENDKKIDEAKVKYNKSTTY